MHTTTIVRLVTDSDGVVVDAHFGADTTPVPATPSATPGTSPSADSTPTSLPAATGTVTATATPAG